MLMLFSAQYSQNTVKPCPTSTLYFIYYTIICLYVIIFDSDLSLALYGQTMSKSVHIAKTPIFSNLNYCSILSLGLEKYNLVLLIFIENTTTVTIFLSLSFSPCYSTFSSPFWLSLLCHEDPYLPVFALEGLGSLSTCHFHSLLTSNCSSNQLTMPVFTYNTFKRVLLCILFTAFNFQGSYNQPKSNWQISLKPLLKTFPSCNFYNRGSQFIMLPLLPVFLSSLIS